MARFHELEVTVVRKTIRDAVEVTLSPRNGEDFSFLPGQYLTFRRVFDGTELRRSYSICTSPSEGALKVGIKKVEGGAFSSWVNEELSPGMMLEAMPPMGTFHVEITPGAVKSYLAFAGGSGITPVLSILKTVLEQEPEARFTLVYANRAVHTIMFREEIEDLKNRHMGRLTVIHILETQAQDVDLFTGRVDDAKCDALFETLINIPKVDTALICGPEPMMLTIAGALKRHGMDAEQIKFELFKSGQPGRLPQAAKRKDAVEPKAVEAEVIIEGTAHNIRIQIDESVLAAALSAGLDAPYACTAGVCSTCKCRVIEGEVEMIANHALEDYEVERGYRLACQSYPVSERLKLAFEH